MTSHHFNHSDFSFQNYLQSISMRRRWKLFPTRIAFSSWQTVIEVLRRNQIMTPSTMQSERKIVIYALSAFKHEESEVFLWALQWMWANVSSQSDMYPSNLREALQAMISHLNGMNPLFTKRRQQSLISKNFSALALFSVFHPLQWAMATSNGTAALWEKLFLCNSSMLFRSFEVKLLWMTFSLQLRTLRRMMFVLESNDISILRLLRGTPRTKSQRKATFFVPSSPAGMRWKQSCGND